MASHSISVGGALVRNDVVAVLDGEGAQCTLNGLYLADGQRPGDNPTTLAPPEAHCGSRDRYKRILQGHTRGAMAGAPTPTASACSSVLRSLFAIGIASSRPFGSARAEDVCMIPNDTAVTDLRQSSGEGS